MKKRILSLALVLMLCLGMSVPALAADSATVGQVNTISLGFNGLAVVDANGTLWVSDPDYQDLGLENRGTSPVFTKIILLLIPFEVSDSWSSNSLIAGISRKLNKFLNAIISIEFAFS